MTNYFTYVRCCWLMLATGLLCFSVLSQAEASTAGPYMKLLKSGRLPANRLAPIVKLVCSRGDSEDLAYVLAETVRPEGFAGPVRLAALTGLVNAVAERDVTPDGDLNVIGNLIRSPGEPADTQAQLLAVQLAGLWEVESVTKDLASLATEVKTTKSLRIAALNALTELDEEAATAAIEKLTAADNPLALRTLGVSALAKVDIKEAAAQAADILIQLTPKDNPASLLQALLDQQAGAAELTSALEETLLTVDAAKVTLRTMYALGRTDKELIDLLSTAAGFSAEDKPLTPEMLKAYSADVVKLGDAARGEAIFRRAEMSCLKCHALNGAGGQVGPDLIGLGGSSPNDYLVESVLVPEKAVKEEYMVVSVLTDEGQVLTGIAKERDEQRLILKDATGNLRNIPIDSIEDEKKGGSLMPKGLAKFLTREEFLDLVKFLSELGRPGGNYERNTLPVIRRWRVLKPESGVLTQSVPDEAVVRQYLLHGDSSQWEPVYSQCSGELPLSAIATQSPSGLFYLQAELQVNKPGEVVLQLNAAEGLTVWLDEKKLASADRITAEVTEGEHVLTFRVDPTARKVDTLHVQLSPAADSAAEFVIVAGQ